MSPASRHLRPLQRGFGLIQALVLLLLVSAALVAGIVLLQSRRSAEQTRTQEDSLRWAEEAVTAFAAANARLPCPAPSMNGTEDCTASRASGWLPLRTLAGASGTAPGIGPLHYAVYRGDAGSHLDLTQPLNAYTPLNLAGEPRTYDKDVTAPDGSTKTEKTPFDAINGLDFCQALGLAGASTTDTALASTSGRNALPLNIAYGLAAAGPMAGTANRFDGSNAAPGATLESPWRAGNSGYDDRVRVQTFAGVAHAVGCRQNTGTAANPTPYNVATASVDTLAAALTLHDSVADLQQNNIGNANAAMRDAGFAQAMSAAQILLAAGHITDTVSSNILAVGELIRAIGTCIASLGATCWEVPLKASSIAMEVASIISYGAALGINIGTVTLTAKALNATITVRERAKNAVIPPAKDVGEAAEKVCVAAHGGIIDKRVVVKRDADGNIVWKRDANGKQLFDANGNPLYEYVEEHNVWQDGLEQQMKQAEEVEGELRRYANEIYNRRILPFSDSQIRYRINEGDSKDLYNGRYKELVCEPYTGSDAYWHNQNGVCVQKFDSDGNLIHGDHRPVWKFKWSVAIADAIEKRKRAEAWSDANRAASEAEEIWKLARDNYDKWNDSLLPAMVSQKNADCAKASSAATAEERERFTQVCRNDEAAITYTQYCKKTERVKQPDGSTIEAITTDTDPDATCLPQLLKKRNDAETAKNTAASTVANRRASYNSQYSPIFNYPSDWAFLMLAEDGKTELGNPKFTWKQTPAGNPPFYSRQKRELLLVNTDIPAIHCIFGSDWTYGTQCEHYPYSRAWNDYVNAKIAADEAKEGYEQLKEQYTMMADRCQRLRAIDSDDPSSTDEAKLAIGAEAVLRLADRLGSVGAQPAADDDGATP